MPRYKYVGPDLFYDIPPRDLSEEEFDALKPRLKRHVIASPSYKEVAEDKPKKKSDEDKGGES